MLDRLRNLFRNQNESRREEHLDPILSSLVLQPDDHEWWEARLELGGQTVTFAIGGELEPSAALLQHARDIVAAWTDFEARVTAFLAQEANSGPLAKAAPEIRALRIDSINLFWPDRPDDGMIYFTGPSEHRIWRCDYVGRQPRDFGFDS